MKSLALRIRKRYFDAIVSGEKTVEFRKASPFWRKRIRDTDVAVFVCGKRTHRRKITYIQEIKTPDWFSDQGKQDVDTETCFAIYLGTEVFGCPFIDEIKACEYSQVCSKQGLKHNECIELEQRGLT